MVRFRWHRAAIARLTLMASALGVVACSEDDARDPIDADTTEASDVDETTDTIDPDTTETSEATDADADTTDTRPEVDAGPFVWPWPLEAMTNG